jgi:Ca2+/H+ antiporter
VINNKDYYLANFIIHVVYGAAAFVSFVYNPSDTGMLTIMLLILMIIAFLLGPIITITIFIVKCTKRWPEELRAQKAWREILLCIVVAVPGWYLGVAVATLLGS